MMKTRIFKATITSLSLFLLPLFAFAAPQTFSGLVNILIDIISALTQVAMALSLLAFFWGIVIFILHSGDAENVSKAKDIMLWGVVALFVLASFWGIIRVIQATFL